MTSQLSGELLRFVLVGGTNTAMTLALLVVLDLVLPLSVAYTIVFLLGVAYTTVLSRSFVFRSGAGAGALTRFVLGYLVVYVVGRLVLRALSETDLPSWSVGLVVIMATVPLTFLIGRLTLPPMAVSEPGHAAASSRGGGPAGGSQRH